MQKTCDVLHFDTDTAKERNWTAVFSYDLLPYNLLWNSGMEVWHISHNNNDNKLLKLQRKICKHFLLTVLQKNRFLSLISYGHSGTPERINARK